MMHYSEIYETILEMGYQLVRYAITDYKDGRILRDIEQLRSTSERHHLILPPIYIKDNPELDPNQFRIILHGEVIVTERESPPSITNPGRPWTILEALKLTRIPFRKTQGDTFLKLAR